VGGDRCIEDLFPPFAVVAADIASGVEVVFVQGLVWAAVLGSVAIPGMYPAQRIGPYTVVDGAVVNPVPVDAVARLGADVVLAVKLSGRAVVEPRLGTAAAPMGRPPAVLEVLTSALDLLQSRVAAPPVKQPTIELVPAVPVALPFGLRHFSAGRAFMDLGEAAVQDALPRLTDLLPWVGAAPPRSL